MSRVVLYNLCHTESRQSFPARLDRCTLSPRLMFSVSWPATAPLSPRDAHIINAVLTVGYVLPLYFTKYTRLSFAKISQNDGTRPKGPSERWRDDPAVIKARLLSVSVSTVASLCLMHYILAAVQSNPLKVSKRRFPGTCGSLIHFHRLGGIQRPSILASLYANSISLPTS